MRLYQRICCLIFMLVLLNLFLYWWLGDRQIQTRNLTRDSLSVETQGTREFTATTDIDMQFKSDDLLRRLNEIENKMLPKTNIVLVIGETRSVENNLAFYQPALEKLGYFIKQGQLGTHIDWAVMLCFAKEDDFNSACFRRSDIVKLKPYQKVSKIPGLQNTLTSSDAFCYLTTAARDIPGNWGIRGTTSKEKTHLAFHANFSYLFKLIGFAKRK